MPSVLPIQGKRLLSQGPQTTANSGQMTSMDHSSHKVSNLSTLTPIPTPVNMGMGMGLSRPGQPMNSLIKPVRLPTLAPSVTKTAEPVIDIDHQPERLLSRLGYLIRSKTVTREKLIAYLGIVVKGLHYSIKCLKPPSLKVIQSRMIKLPEFPVHSRFTSHTEVPSGKTLFLDLDETIAYQCPESEPADYELELSDGQKVD